ncbi:MAG: hypothetical protein ABSB81_11525 [Halobacteriota archaeon]|jgi:hypothetical protein
MKEDKDEIEPINSDDDIEIRYQGLILTYTKMAVSRAKWEI